MLSLAWGAEVDPLRSGMGTKGKELRYVRILLGF